MSIWVLPTISEVIAAAEPELTLEADSLQVKGQAEREWHAAIATMTQLLKQTILLPLVSNLTSAADRNSSTHENDTVEICEPQGLILSGPMPVISDPALLALLQAWSFTPEQGQTPIFQLPPSEALTQAKPSVEQTGSVQLLAADPITTEQFCLVQTEAFSWVAVLTHTVSGRAQFQFSFIPETTRQVLAALRARMQLTRPTQLQVLDPLTEQFPIIEPDYRIPMQFGRQLLKILTGSTPNPMPHPLYAEANAQTLNGKDDHRSQSGTDQPADIPASGNGPSARPLRHQGPGADGQPQSNRLADQNKGNFNTDDIELLKAIAHEVRTPLSTIQTFTRLLLRRSDLPADVLKRLKAIQRECSEQINRFSLIFRAMELTTAETHQCPEQYTAVSLQHILDENIPQWQNQAARRDLKLKVTVPQHLPAVVISDPTMFDQVLTGLIERLSHSLPTGSEIELQVALAGEQLKLQLRSHTDLCHQTQAGIDQAATPILKAVGQLLMLQPETGGLSLSLPVTKHLFQSLGGKLTVRHHQQQGEVLTIFLPLGTERQAY